MADFAKMSVPEHGSLSDFRLWLIRSLFVYHCRVCDRTVMSFDPSALCPSCQREIDAIIHSYSDSRWLSFEPEDEEVTGVPDSGS
jgi:hypothetical protein